MQRGYSDQKAKEFKIKLAELCKEFDATIGIEIDGTYYSSSINIIIEFKPDDYTIYEDLKFGSYFDGKG